MSDFVSDISCSQIFIWKYLPARLPVTNQLLAFFIP